MFRLSWGCDNIFNLSSFKISRNGVIGRASTVAISTYPVSRLEHEHATLGGVLTSIIMVNDAQD